MFRRITLATCLTAACLALLPLADAAAATRPVVTLVSPMRVHVGARLTIRGRHFRPGRSANTVIFRAPGGRVAFAKARRATRTKIVVVVPSAVQGLVPASSVDRAVAFRLRVLSGRHFGRYTVRRLSPVIVLAASGSSPGASPGGDGSPGSSGPGTPGPGDSGSGAPAAVPSDCDGDGTANAEDADDDNDLLPDTLEAQLKTDPCQADTDGDQVDDGFEYRSAVDLNDDEFQDPNTSLPYPGKRPYPNPLDPSDGNTDYDGDSLTLSEEQSLWTYTISQGAPRDLAQLTYDDGEQYTMSVRGSDGRRRPTLAAAGYSKQQEFLTWASSNGYRQVLLSDGPPWYDHDSPVSNLYGLLDFNRDGAESAAPGGGVRWAETLYYDIRPDGYLSDDERDEDADGLTNYDELHGRGTPAYWKSCYSSEAPFPIAYGGADANGDGVPDGTDPMNPDMDGDGVRDGADDQDHDDVPNVMELSRNLDSGEDDRKAGQDCKAAEGLPSPPATNHASTYGRVNPYNPCLPASWSRTCPLYAGSSFAPFDDSPNWYSLN
jgi:hypothetical protein